MAQLNYDWNVNDLDYSRGYDKYSDWYRIDKVSFFDKVDFINKINKL